MIFLFISCKWEEESAYKYWIQYSADGQIWLPLVDKTDGSAPEIGTEIEFTGKLKSAQYIKVLFTEASATPFAIAEIHIEGTVSIHRNRYRKYPCYERTGNDRLLCEFAE